MPKVYTVKEVSLMLKLGRNATYKLMNSKTFPSYKINNKFFVNEDDLIKWMHAVRNREVQI